MMTNHNPIRHALWLSSFPYHSAAIRLHEISWIRLKPMTFHFPVNFQIRILICQSGFGEIFFSGRQYSLTPGTAVLADCRCEVTIQTTCQNWELICVAMSSSLADSLYYFAERDSHLFTTIQPEMVPLCEKIYETALLKNNGENDIRLSSMLYSLLGLMSMMPTMSSRISCVISYINTHYDQRIELQELADLIFLSKYHFLRVFQEEMGQTPHSYLQEVRIKKAASFLLTTTQSITLIAEKVGYTDRSYFSEQFKKHMGMLPREYRRMFTDQSKM